MASAKGYRSYRGRVSKLKVFLAVLLCLVILAAVGVIFLQEHMVYDENGVRRLVIPWMEREDDPPAPEKSDSPVELDLVIEGPVGPPAVHAFSLPAEALTPALWQEQRNVVLLSSAVPYDAVSVTLKDSSGNVYFDSGTAASRVIHVKKDTAEALAEITASDLRSIARVSCLPDTPTARANVTDMGLKNTSGYIFRDANKCCWLDPAKPAAAEYLSALVVEAAELGFDEILLTDVSYPTEGKLDKIAYTGEEELSRNLTAFLRAVKKALEPYEDLTVSIELPERVVAIGREEDAGLVLAEIAPLVDRVYAVTSASMAQTLAGAVTAVNEDADFVPELALESQAAGVERCMVLQQAAP